MFLISKMATYTLLPPGLFLILLFLSLLLIAAKRRKTGLVLASVSLFLLYALSTGIVADALLRPLEDRYPALDKAAAMEGGFAGAPVVVLGGGSVDRSPEENFHASLADEPMKRLSYGIRMARDLDRPLLFSGGRVYKSDAVESEARAARRLIEKSAPDLEASFEDESRTTLENARLIKEKFGAVAVVLVTSAYHMPRSVLSFEKAGVKTLPAPTAYRVDRSGLWAVDFLPTIEDLRNSTTALHEYLGLLGYRLAR